MHCRFRTRIYEAHFINPWTHIDYSLGSLDFVFMRKREHNPVFNCFLYTFHHRRMTVSQDDWPESQLVIDVFVFIKIPEIGPFRTCNADVLTFAPLAKIGAHAEGHNFFGGFEKCIVSTR